MSDNPSTPEDELPVEVLRDKLTAANNEAARFRVKAREAAATAKAETTAEFEAQITALETDKADLAGERDAARLELAKLTVALSAGIPAASAPAFARLLSGTTEDELKAHAEEIRGLLNIAPDDGDALDPSQGHGGSAPDPNGGDFFASFVFRD